MPRTLLAASLGFAALLLLVRAANAQSAPVWRVVAGDAAELSTPDLPAGTSRQLLAPQLADRGQDRVGFLVSLPASLAGYWAWHGGRFQRWAQIGSSGAAGPGRSGAEAGHQFLELRADSGEAGADGQRLLLARAGDPAQSAQARYGLWRWQGSANVEIARAGSDGSLGPGFGSGWVFPDSSGFATGYMLGGGQAMLFTDLRSPTGGSAQAVLRHVPGLGNRPCLRTLTSEAGLSPGLSAGDSFVSINPGTPRFAASADGRVFALLATSAGRSGLFELCDGAPRAFAATFETGARGPEVGEIDAVFADLERPHPASAGRTVFFASWRVPPAAARPGLFVQDGGRNRPLAYNEASGEYGPNWNATLWSSFASATLGVAGDWAAFRAVAGSVDGGSWTGLWRVRSGQGPELLALLDHSAAPYAPAPGRSWRSFHAFAVLADGRIVLDASTDPGSSRELWLLSAGRAPQRLLSTGQVLSVPTTQGTVQTTVASYSLPGAATPEAGDDGWIGADGQLLVSVSSATLGRLLISTRLAPLDPDAVFFDGFE